MGTDFSIDTNKVRATANAIKKDTDELRPQTDTWLNKVDDTSKRLPSIVYQSSWAAIIDIRAFLNRSMEERDRISTILQAVAKQVETVEQQIEKTFQDTSGNQPPHK